MDSNKVLVFDNHHYFSRFLKYEFKEIKFTNGEKDSILYGSELNNSFSLIVYVLYSEEDLIDLIRLYAYGIKLLVCNHNPKFANKFINIKNMAVLDCLETKKGFRTDLRLYFNQAF